MNVEALAVILYGEVLSKTDNRGKLRINYEEDVLKCIARLAFRAARIFYEACPEFRSKNAQEDDQKGGDV